MTLQLEEGKFYLTRDGRKVGPVERSDLAGQQVGKRGEAYPWHWDDVTFTDDGRCAFDVTELSRDDLVAEWTDEPAPPAPAMTIQQARIEALRIALSTQPWVLVVGELDNVERAAQFIIEGVK